MDDQKLDLDIDLMTMPLDPWIEKKLRESQVKIEEMLDRENYTGLAALCAYWMSVAATAVGKSEPKK